MLPISTCASQYDGLACCVPWTQNRDVTSPPQALHVWVHRGTHTTRCIAPLSLRWRSKGDVAEAHDDISRNVDWRQGFRLRCHQCIRTGE
jgi:hypothetical protein